MSAKQPDTLTYPTSDEIEPELARVMFEHHCAILIIEDLPVASEFGIDLSEFVIGEKFRGVKLIPPGLHFVYARCKEKTTSQSGPRCGFFHNFTAKELLIKRWSTLEEEFDESFHPKEDELTRYQSNRKNLDQYLGAYRFSTYNDYLSITHKITNNLLSSLMPSSKTLRSVPFLVRKPQSSGYIQTQQVRLTRAGSSVEDSLLPDLTPDEKTIIQFSKIPQSHSCLSIAPESITQYHLDSTLKLETSFSGEKGLQILLGEFQFAFIVFILFHVYECFEKWKELLSLVCMAEHGITKFTSFYHEFITVLRYQFNHIPEDLFEGIVDGSNLMRGLLDTLFQNINESCGIDMNLRARALELKFYLSEKFGWQFDLELEDDQPTVVEL